MINIVNLVVARFARSELLKIFDVIMKITLPLFIFFYLDILISNTF